MSIYQCTRCMRQCYGQPPRKCPACGGRTFGTLAEPDALSVDDVARAAPEAGDVAGYVDGAQSVARLEVACRQEGGFLSKRLGHVRGICFFPPGHDGPHSWEPDGPPTPRDMPEGAGFDTLSYELAREERHAHDAAELGGATCGEQGCGKPATHKFFWPSPDLPPTRFACEEHAKRAGEISATLGFDADPQPL